MEIELTLNERKLAVSALRRRMHSIDSIYSRPERRVFAASAIAEALLLIEDGQPLPIVNNEMTLQLRKALYWAARQLTGWGMSHASADEYRRIHKLIGKLSREADGIVRVRATLTESERAQLLRVCRRAIARRRSRPTWFSTNGSDEPGRSQANLLEVLYRQAQQGTSVELVERQIQLLSEILMSLVLGPSTIVERYPLRRSECQDPHRLERLQQQCLAAERRLRLLQDLAASLDRQSAAIFSTYELNDQQ